MNTTCRIRVKGIVQGVGFRPFIYRLAREHQLTGNVHNDSRGVLITAQGSRSALEDFIREIPLQAPPLSRVDGVETEEITAGNYRVFSVTASQNLKEKSTFIPPDTRTCDQCLSEYDNPKDRRFRYPFITCTHCGPRFSIIQDIPYDRRHTTMAPFPLCPDCLTEYRDPGNRRFHTEPTACDRCGPVLSLFRTAEKKLVSGDTEKIVARVINGLDQGKIVAIKGVGGYHLACDATSTPAVQRLRKKKNRPFKPFALMTGNIESVRKVARVDKAEEAVLLSKERPIVLLKERRNSLLSPQIAPHLSFQGIMLPYSPFQHSLFRRHPEKILVMTSANISDEPIIFRDEEIFDKMGDVADLFVTYNREIHSHSDDSVLFVLHGKPRFIRRSKGYVPVPFFSSPAPVDILATGGDLKNCFGLAKDHFLIISQPSGDLQSPATQETFRRSLDHFSTLFDLQPRLIVSDRHPGYYSSQIADGYRRPGIREIKVYHHHAHIASVMEECRVEDPVIGLAFDGTGYGTDNHIWGSEFLIVRPGEFKRAAHLSYFPLPGGEQAITEVYRIGLALLHQAGGGKVPRTLSDRDRDIIRMIEQNLNCPQCCSLGRLFDGISSLLGLSRVISTEAEAAVKLEEAAWQCNRPVPSLEITITENPAESVDFLIHTPVLVKAVTDRLRAGMSIPVISKAFHQAVTDFSDQICQKLREKYRIDRVALSGGVFQNRLLLGMIITQLEKSGFEVLTHRELPPNDGCIAHGQLSIAKALLSRGDIRV